MGGTDTSNRLNSLGNGASRHRYWQQMCLQACVDAAAVCPMQVVFAGNIRRITLCLLRTGNILIWKRKAEEYLIASGMHAALLMR